jgi:hypothetical protein
LVWSLTFHLGVGFTDLGGLGQYWGQNKAIVGAPNGSVVCGTVGVVLIFLAGAVVLVKNLTSSYFEKLILAVEYR